MLYLPNAWVKARLQNEQKIHFSGYFQFAWHWILCIPQVWWVTLTPPTGQTKEWCWQIKNHQNLKLDPKKGNKQQLNMDNSKPKNKEIILNLKNSKQFSQVFGFLGFFSAFYMHLFYLFFFHFTLLCFMHGFVKQPFLDSSFSSPLGTFQVIVIISNNLNK